MAKITMLGKNELAELGLKFISIDVPAFPVRQKTYMQNCYWFLSLDKLKEQCSKIDPLIIFDQNKQYTEPKTIKDKILPDEIVKKGEGYLLRAVVDMDKDDWAILKKNILCPTDHNFTFEWDLEHYPDPEVDKRKALDERIKRMSDEADRKEAEEANKHRK